MSCILYNGKILKSEDIQQLTRDHSDFFIEGLTFDEQRSVVKSLAYEMYRQDLKNKSEGKEDKTDIHPFLQKLSNKLNLMIEEQKEFIESQKLLEEEGYEMAIQDAETLITKYTSILNNFTKISKHVQDFLVSYTKGKVTRADETLQDNESNDSEISDETPESVGIERTDFGDNFYFELDTRRTMSSELQKFLAFIPDFTYNKEGEKIPVTNLIDESQFVDFDIANNELHRILVGVKPTVKDVTDRLQQEANASELTKNDVTSWVKDALELYQQLPSHVQKQFNTEMAKHKIEMFFVQVFSQYDPETKGQKYSFRLLSDNSGDTSIRLRQVWEKAHKKSDILKGDFYDDTVVTEVLNELQRIQDIQLDVNERINSFINILNTMGVSINRMYAEELFKAEPFVKIGNKSIQINGIINELRVIVTRLKPVKEVDKVVPKSTLDVEPLKEALFTALAIGAAKYELQEFSNAFRVGGKLIYTYSMNQYMVNRFRDLVNDPFLLQRLNQTLYAQHSTYLHHLMDDSNEFSTIFKAGYVSLEPLKYTKKFKQGSRNKRTDKITETSEVDYLVSKLGYFNKKSKYTTITYKGKQYLVREANYFFPTISDKSRAMSVQALAYNATTRVKEGDKAVAVFSESAIELFYEAVVLPEIERIHKSSNEAFIEGLNLKNYRGDLFYSIPALNENKDLLNAIQNNGIVSEAQKQEIFNAIKEFLMQEVVKEKENWEKLGLIENNKLVHFAAIPQPAELAEDTYVSTEKEKDGKRKPIRYAKEAVMDFVFNYAMFNANMFQLVIGDPAQYYKKNIDTTNNNIIKRLAAEAAPGYEFEGEDYIQVFADDIMKKSTSFEYLLDLLDGISMKQFEAMDENQKKQLKAYPYFEMESTNAQEYTTWREHLGILRGTGQITEREFSEAYDAFEKGKIPSTEVFNKVLQPIKPVYSYNDFREVGKGTLVDVKTYIKTSSFPLIPAMTAGLQLDAVREAMEKLERNQKKPVRLSFASGTKVGFSKTPAVLDLKDGSGNLKKEIDLAGKWVLLKREGFRIQQDIPHDPTKREVTVGSQSMKLVWANFIHEKLPKAELERRQALKQEYIDLFHELYKQGINDLHDDIAESTKDGYKVANEKLQKKLLKKLKEDKVESKALQDGLKINPLTRDFEVPLWLSPYSDKYMSMLMSLVRNAVLSKKFPGKSYVLGSEAGIKIVEGKEAENLINDNENKIVFTDSFDASKGLQIQYESDGTVKSAQVLVPFKFMDDRGNPLKVKDFMDGNKLDLKRVPPELLKSFGFRIPTSLHANMATIEIVGFLPETLGDLVIAPAEFTVQMGSDFDVDKLYMYLFDTQYNKETKTLVKTPYDPEGSLKSSRLRKDLKQLSKDLSKETISKVKELVENLIETKGVLGVSNQNVRDVIKEFIEEDIAVNSYGIKYLEVQKQLTTHIGAVKNRLIDIHLEIVEHPDVQKSVALPLGFGKHKEMIAQIESTYDTTKKNKSILLESYHRNKFYDGTAGKAGVGMFSLDSVFNVLSQGLDMILQHAVKLPDGSINTMPVYVEFGNKYNPSKGELSNIYSNKKDNPRYKTELISADQNLSVDNANEQGMHVINLNQFTFQVKSLLNVLGFEEDISDLFLAQPILIEYVNELRNSKSILKNYTPGIEKEIRDKLVSEYADNRYGNTVGPELADFSGKDAHQVMLNLLKNGKNEPDYGNYQAAILDKFIHLNEIAKPLSKVKRLLNIDTKGFNRTIYINKKNLESVYELKEGLVLNADKLLGNFVEVGDKLVLEPNSTAGFDVLYGLQKMVDLFGPYFMETQENLGFDKIVRDFELATGKEINEKSLLQLRDHYKMYLLSNINVSDIDALRKEYFLNTEKGSLYDRLKRIKETNFGKSNTFLRRLEVTFEGAVQINYDNARGEAFNESDIYKGFIDLFINSTPIGDIDPTKLVEDLVIYSLMRGGNKANQFMKFIPPNVLKKIVTIPDVNNNHVIFLNQYLRHNSDLVPGLPEGYKVGTPVKGNYTVLKVNENGSTESAKLDLTHIALDNVLLIKNKNSDTYFGYPYLGKEKFTEYTPNTKGNSIFSSNASIPGLVAPKNNPLQRSYTEPEITPEEVRVSTKNAVHDKLNFDNTQQLLESISKLTDPEFAQYAVIAKVFLSNATSFPVLVTKEEGNSNYNPATNTLTLTTNKESKSLLVSVFHEYLHSLSYNQIQAFGRGEVTDGAVLKSLSNLNGLKNNIIDKALRTEKGTKGLTDVIRNYVLHLMRTADGTVLQEIPVRLRNIAQESNRNVHPEVKKLIAQAISDVKEGNLTAAVPVSGTNNIFFYSLLDLNEFVAVSGSHQEIRDLMLQYGGEKYKRLIIEFFKAILDLLGMSNIAEQKLMEDIFVVSGIKPAEVVVKKENEEFVQQEKPVSTEVDQIYAKLTKSDNVKIVQWSELKDLTEPFLKAYGFISHVVSTRIKNSDKHFGNPFSSDKDVLEQNKSLIPVATTEEAIKKYVDWILNSTDGRAKWIRQQLQEGGLKDKPVLYTNTSAQKEGKITHADALDYLINKYNWNKNESLDEFDVSPFDVSKDIKELENISEDLMKRCKGKTQARQGLRDGVQLGGKWSLVKDLKGFPTHEKGGVDLSIVDGKVSIRRGNSVIEAKYGMLLPALKEKQPEPKREVYSNKWSLVQDLEGFPSHEYGGVSLNIENGAVSFSSKDAKVHAKCGLYMSPKQAEEGVIIEPTYEPITRKKREIALQENTDIATEKKKNLYKKPKINAIFANLKDLINSADPVGNKIIQDELIKKYEELNNITSKLWKE